MTTETEARLLDINEQEFIDKLKNHNATFVGDWLQIRNVYDFSPKRENEWIRLRTNGKTTTLTIKNIQNKSVSGTKECEIEVSDFETTNELLNKLGYHARSSQENRRIRYILNDVEIDIDFWPKIPTYVEFEAKSEQKIIDILNLLGFDYSLATTKGVVEIYKHYDLDIYSLPQKLSLEESRKNKKYDL